MRPQITLLVCCLFPFFAVAQTEAPTQIYFQEESLEFTESGKAQIEHFTKDLLSSAERQMVIIESYPGYSIEFREKRARYLAEILQKENIKVERIVYYASYEQLPKKPDPLDVKDYCGLVTKSVAIPIDQPAIEEAVFTRAVKQQAQPISPNPFNREYIANRDTVILTLPEGTKLTIPPFAFAYLDGSEYEGEVIIKSKEVLDLATAILEDMTTQSPDGYLESKGMIIVEAETPAGEELALRTGKSIAKKILGFLLVITVQERASGY
ncbi:MAG: hypothetical protein AAF598_00755 [Bacteroidota bacterium]